VALIFVVRSINLARRLRVVQAKLKKAEQVPEPVSFDQYLRDELHRNQDLIELAAASQDDAEKKATELLEVRKRFLELEVQARALENNPIAFPAKLAAGLSELVEQLRSEAETVTEPVVEGYDIITQLEEAATEQEQSEQRKPLDTHDAEFDRLKEVINNQQDAMQALRKAEDEILPQEERHALEIKIQELEALVEFKDAAIEELEKQYSELEARFLAAAGEKNVD